MREGSTLASIWTPPATGQAAIYPADYVAGPMFGDHPDDEPPLVFSDTELVDVLDESTTIAAVIVAVIFRGDLVLFSAQVEDRNQASSAKQW